MTWRRWRWCWYAAGGGRRWWRLVADEGVAGCGGGEGWRRAAVEVAMVERRWVDGGGAMVDVGGLRREVAENSLERRRKERRWEGGSVCAMLS
ncbi:hypothetical protein Tco_0721838 [Tanacetum coccineum]